MNSKRVIVAMSGGVDSSVTAALLKEQGHEVIGVTMQIWPSELAERDNFRSCCSLSAVEDARRVAAKLDIPYYVMNFKDVFKKKVIDNFCSEYKEGRTPNPCIRCNQYIKFDALLEKAKGLGANYIATGHYARIEEDQRYLLKKGRDSNKDQSYFLYTLTQEQLKHVLMPLGNLTKEKTRRIASDLGLKVASKPGSQEICFIPNNDYSEFIKEVMPEEVKPGPILDKQGNILGLHGGILFYTVGQRRGLGIAASEPLYVVTINKEKNALIVGREGDVLGDELIAGDLNYIGIEELRDPIEVQAKIRYNTSLAEAVVYPIKKDKIRVKFKEPQKAITPGQAVVFYQEDILIGGGTIT